MEMNHHLPRKCKVVKPLQADPKAFCAGFSIAFSSEKASELCNHPGSLAERGWMRRWNGGLDREVSAVLNPRDVVKELLDDMFSKLHVSK